MDSLPAGRSVEKGVLEIDHTRFQNEGQAVLVETITNYVERTRVLQEFQVVRQSGTMEMPGGLPLEVKKALESAKNSGGISRSPTKRIGLMEEGRLLNYTTEPFHSARIDESGRYPYQQYNVFLSAGLFQKQGFLSQENLRLATVSGNKDPLANSLEITLARSDFTAVIALDPATVRPRSCAIQETNGNSQLWEYEWAGDGKSIPAQVTITRNSKGFSQTDNFRYRLASETTKPEDFEVEFAYATTVEYLPPPNGGQLGSIIYKHNPAIDVQSLIALRFQFVLSRQERKNCATAILKPWKRSSVCPSATPQASSTSLMRTRRRDEARQRHERLRDTRYGPEQGLYSEIVRTDINHLADLGDDTLAIFAPSESATHSPSLSGVRPRRCMGRAIGYAQMLYILFAATGRLERNNDPDLCKTDSFGRKQRMRSL